MGIMAATGYAWDRTLAPRLESIGFAGALSTKVLALTLLWTAKCELFLRCGFSRCNKSSSEKWGRADLRAILDGKGGARAEKGAAAIGPSADGKRPDRRASFPGTSSRHIISEVYTEVVLVSNYGYCDAVKGTPSEYDRSHIQILSRFSR